MSANPAANAEATGLKATNVDATEVALADGSTITAQSTFVVNRQARTAASATLVAGEPVDVSHEQPLLRSFMEDDVAIMLHLTVYTSRVHRHRD